jgi:predicted Zn finger-like uncharacterized protein
MDQIRITQCPKCDTTFRITPSQLQIAKGAVRCGACLHVFRASEHFQQPAQLAPAQQDDRTHDMFKNATPQPDLAPQTDMPQTRSQDPLNDASVLDSLFAGSDDVLDTSHDALFASDDNSLAQSHDELLNSRFDTPLELNDGKSSEDATPSASLFNNDNDHTGLNLGDELIEDSNNLLADNPPSPASQLTAEEDDEYGLIDDDNGLIDDDIYHNERNKAPDFDEEFLTLNDQDSADPFFSDGEKFQEAASKAPDSDESWAHALLDENDVPEKAPSKASAKPSPVKPKAAILNTIPSGFSYIESDPLELELPKQAQKRQILIWFTASLLLVILFVLQSAYFNFNQWARLDSYRPFYQVACEHLKCTVPSSYDLARIRTTASPQVSSHPRFKDALVVDVLFINGAEYAQAFPQLSLTFSDKEDKVIAHRLFQPFEYLAGEAAGLTMMPAQTPIHIALEIADPGPSANNYQVHFLQP